jgi:hypothetical protein
VEQPCWCEDCALLVWLISRILKSVYGYLRWMLTLVLQGPRYEGTIYNSIDPSF